jgi:hypothetical protein
VYALQEAQRRGNSFLRCRSNYSSYRDNHPKIDYATLKEAAAALKDTRRSSVGTPHEKSNYRLVVYWDESSKSFHIGHQPR